MVSPVVVLLARDTLFNVQITLVLLSNAESKIN